MAWTPAVIAVGTAAIWFAAFMLAHILGWRAGRDHARWLLMTYLTSVIGTVVTAIAFAPPGSPVLSVVLALMTNACLFVVYVPAVYTVLTSLSVQTMVMMRARGGTMPATELYERFAGRVIVNERLATLVASGYLAGEGQRFRLTSRGRALARAFAFVKAFWKLGPGG
jgi:hypothetical protein